MIDKISKKGYYFRVIRTVSVILLVTVTVIIVSSYFITQNILLSAQAEKNEEMMNNIAQNITISNSSIRSLCEYMYISRAASDVLTADTENMEDVAVKISSINAGIMAAMPYLHSLQIYNAQTGNIYYVGLELEKSENQLKDIMKLKDKIKNFSITPRAMRTMSGTKARTENVLSYFIYESIGQISGKESFMAVNINTAWLEDSLRVLCGDGEYVCLYDNDKSFIGATEKMPGIQGLKLQNKPSYEEKINGNRYIITEKYLEDLNVYVVKVQRKAIVLKPLKTLRLLFFAAGLLTLVIVMLIGFSAARIIYSPVGRLYKSIFGEDGGVSEDELLAIDDIYQRVSKEAAQLRKKRKTGEDYIIRKIVKSGQSVLKGEVEELFTGSNPIFSENGFFVVVMTDMDDYGLTDEKPGEAELFKYGIINIACEVLGEYYKSKGVSVENGKSAIIVQIPEEDSDYEEKLGTCAEQIRKYIFTYFERYVSIFISRPTEDIFEIDDITERIAKKFVYKFNFEQGCILTEDAVEDNLKNTETSIEKRLSDKLYSSMLALNEEDIAATLAEAAEQIRKMNYMYETENLIRIVHIMNEAIVKLGKGISFDYVTVTHEIMRESRLDDAVRRIMEEIRLIIKKYKVQAQEANDKNLMYLANSVKEKIDTRFSDSGLCAAMIADELKISPRRISKIFKDTYDVSIAEYINRVRMEYAASLLTEKGMTVLQAAKKSGFDNETYFYRLFKDRYGMTPKEYVYNQIIDNVKGENHE